MERRTSRPFTLGCSLGRDILSCILKIVDITASKGNMTLNSND